MAFVRSEQRVDDRHVVRSINNAAGAIGLFAHQQRHVLHTVVIFGLKIITQRDAGKQGFSSSCTFLAVFNQLFTLFLR